MRSSIKIIFLFFFITINCKASNIITGETVQISEPVAENLIIAGGNVYINAKLEKDLLGAAGEFEINDSIMQDVLIGGGEIRINGVIGEDLRVFGGEIKVLKDVLGDLIVTGGDIEIASEVTIYGNLIVAGGSINIQGQIKGKTEIAGGDVEFSGVSSGPLNIKAGNLTINGQINERSEFITQSLELKENARFSADVEYYNVSGEIDFSDKLINDAKATYNPALKSDLQDMDWGGMKRGFAAMMIYWVFASFLLIVLGIWLFRRFLDQRTYHIREKALNNLGLGLLFFLAVPAGIFATFVTVIGIPVGLITMIAYLVLIALSKVITAVVASFVIQDEMGREWSGGQLMLVAIGVYLVLRLVGAIPFVGSLVNILVVFIAFGTIIQLIRQRNHPVEEI